MPETRILLDNVRSAHNVGAILRTADAAGVSCLYLGGYTPAPIDRFGRVQPEIAKTALGAESTVPWQVVSDAEACLETCRQDGFTIVAVEQASSAVSLPTFSPPDRVVYVFGNEVDGISDDICARADTIVEIPMRGSKESLNVSVSVGIVLYHRCQI